MSYADHVDLPAWVWDLIDAYEKYEDEHPSLYMSNVRDEWIRYPCFGTTANAIIPREVREAASLMRRRRGDDA